MTRNEILDTLYQPGKILENTGTDHAKFISEALKKLRDSYADGFYEYAPDREQQAFIDAFTALADKTLKIIND